GVVANDDVELTVARGAVHALVGENGAGKSTLMKILYGMQRPDEGSIEVDGRRVSFKGPADAIAAGLGMVHQHFMLADNLTVLENIVLGAEPRRFGALDRGAARLKIAEISRAYGLTLDPDRRVEDLGVGERQRVEIAKVLYRGARILILDEPTAVLVPQEVDALFASLQDLRAQGLTVVFISHKLDEVLQVADAVTVLRRGRSVASVDPRETTARELARLMVGGELPSPARTERIAPTADALTVTGLTLHAAAGRTVLDDITLTVGRGEIVGIAGVEGNGQSELVEALIGLRPAAGRVLLAGADISTWSTRRRRAAGIGYVPEDRQRQGLLLGAPLWENRLLGHLGGLLLDRRRARRETADIVRTYDVRTPGVDTPAFALSGGNQQKLMIGRELAGGPVLLLAAHPTRGVDVGAQAAIWAQLRTAVAAGLGVLLISADLEELLGLSDRLLVMLRGKLVAAVDPRATDAQALGAAMTGAAA
ncbi:MAG TPA: ABC transporter ATP-binding protein, partial [Mycobacteriales bacterium]|nr:ABC transporter ATP-binding protein [Mycobacteriales bacterium]